jgi:hypothetical protein
MAISVTNEVPATPLVKCAYCGTEGSHRIHSGVYECQDCWDWRKLNSPAARYWYILSRMVSSSVDTYDLLDFFPKELGLSKDDIAAFNRIISTMAAKTGEMATAHHVDERWLDQAKQLFDQLENGIRPKPE